MVLSASPAEHLSRLRNALPEVTHVAEALSLAVRAEPELVRQVRLFLLPRSTATLEADLYFSPLVSQRTNEWISLDPDFSAELQLELGARLDAGEMASREQIRHVREIVEMVHSSAPIEIRREEELLWLAVERKGDLQQARNAIDSKLRDLLMGMLRVGEESIAIARWFASAARRLPRLAQETQSFTTLAFAASSLLGGRKVKSTTTANLDIFETLARYLPDSVQRTPVWISLTTRGLHIRPSAALGYRSFDVPLTNPVLLEVQTEASSPTLVQVTPGQARFEPLPPGPVSVRTISRDLLRLVPRLQVHRETHVKSPVSDSGNIFISYSRKSSDFVRRLSSDLRRNGFATWTYDDLEAGGDWKYEIERAIVQTDSIIVVIDSSSADSSTTQSEWRSAQERGKRLIPILLDGNAGSMPLELRHIQFLDFRESGRYAESLEALFSALGEQQSLGALFGVPALPESFVPRVEILLKTAKALREGVVAGLVGYGGFGKTTLAIAFARDTQTRETYRRGIFFIPASVVRQGSMELTPGLPMRMASIANSTESDVKARLESGRCLVILDDVSSVREIYAFRSITSSEYPLLFTTRDSKIATETKAQVIEVGAVTETEEAAIRERLQDALKALGPHHPDVARAMKDLARHLQGTGRLTEAEPLIRQALAIDEKALGPDHPDVARDQIQLSGLLSAKGDFDEALAAARAIRDGTRRAHTLTELGQQLRDVRKDELLEEALAAVRGIEDDNSRMQALTRLTPQLTELSRSELTGSALELLKQQEAIWRRLGDDRNLGFCYWNWGLLARAQGDDQDSRQKLERALKLFTELKMYREGDAVRAELRPLTAGETESGRGEGGRSEAGRPKKRSSPPKKKKK